MHLLANENIPGDSIDLLRLRGHDVAWVRADAPGSTDDAVLARATAERRVLVTFDKDFGELVFRRGRDASAGVVLFRITFSHPAALALRIANLLESRADWEGHFSVIEETRIRMVTLPPSAGMP
jgi:predicted nuclease of predicted toxin-antitoxin system